MLGKRLFRANQRVKRYLSNHPWYKSYLDIKGKGQLRKTRVYCSNPFCCGNRRKYEGITLQEKRQFLRQYDD
jgi:hypothetical protein